VLGGEGEDFIRGGEFNDVLAGGVGSDLIIARAGNDLIFGRNAPDRSPFEYAEGELDFIAAGEGNDRIYAQGTLIGGPGNDTIYGAGRLEGRDGDDTLNVFRVSVGDRTTSIDAFGYGGAGNDTLIAGQRSSIYGPFGGDGARLYGGDGDDELDAFLSNAVLTGGAGVDTFGVTGVSFGGVFQNTIYGSADIQDFEDGIDRLGFRSTTAREQVGNDVVFSASNGSEIAILRNTDISLIDDTDFLF